MSLVCLHVTCENVQELRRGHLCLGLLMGHPGDHGTLRWRAADTDRAGPCPAGSAPACTLIGAMQSHSIVRQLSVAHKGQSRVACNAECQAFLGTMALPGGAQPTQIELGLAPPVAPLHAPWSGRCRVTASSANSVSHTRVRAASRATQDPSSVFGDHGTPRWRTADTDRAGPCPVTEP